MRTRALARAMGGALPNGHHFRGLPGLGRSATSRDHHGTDREQLGMQEEGGLESIGLLGNCGW